ncbi:hypothetical protein [Vreelandella aquamarina]|uniref:hypothetical protein n=1 Tax=Vreelandella aquamarina TaxID=77097 RepID=UPI0007831D92|nr:hypothetical protein [Halomonas axialensis]
MTNFELNDKAQQLADTSSAYELARRLIEMEQERDQLRGCFYNACGELTALKAALVNEGDEAPIGAALSLVERLKAERDASAAYAEDLRKAGNRAICYGGAESSDEWHRLLSERSEGAASIARMKAAMLLDLARDYRDMNVDTDVIENLRARAGMELSTVGIPLQVFEENQS